MRAGSAAGVVDLRLSPQRNAFESSCSMSVACEIIIVAFGFCRTVRAETVFEICRVPLLRRSLSSP